MIEIKNLDGASVWATDEATLVGAYLAGVNFSGADLRGFSFRGACLIGARLRGADLSGACLVGASLSGACLVGASLSGADLSGACLVGANLSGACLVGADLSGADLIDVRLFGADLSEANLIGVRQGWDSHVLLSEILWAAAGDDEARRMLAAYVERRDDWCWPDWAEFQHAEKAWALAELHKYVLPGDCAPSIVREAAAFSDMKEEA